MVLGRWGNFGPIEEGLKKRVKKMAVDLGHCRIHGQRSVQVVGSIMW